ncbi:MAG TPA: UDP-N-acetylglucosamine 2-epimerase (non-hydrolyzing), partial [Methylomirabilota bacterium]|nr:UDP-N-acetylglucosamine 2-epimerase (non-hydrolyzing) [Methylomirabilota bacterium]
MKLCVVVGTRPEIIKMSPIIKACQKRAVAFDIVHARQHFSDNMCDVFFRDLELPTPAFSFEVTAGGHAQQIASLLLGFDRIFSNSSYSVVLVQGDTNAVFAAAMIASRYQIPIGHVEAGLRSGDRSMPEEINRILVDHLATYLFAASSESHDNLKREGIRKEHIWITGNTVVDATVQAVERAKKNPLQNGLMKEYVLLTLHRPGNVDEAENLKEIIEGIQQVSDKYNLSVIFPIHPRAKAKILES